MRLFIGIRMEGGFESSHVWI